MKITVVGTGYVGLVTGTCLAETGNNVTCVDCNAEKIEQLTRGRMPIYEPGLGELIRRNSASGLLRFSTDLAGAVAEAKIVFLAVGTPPADDGSVDLSALWSVVAAMAPHLAPGAIVVLKSTVPVGTNAATAARLRELTGRDCHVASNPEFLKEGTAIDDFMKPDRVVIGTRSPEVRDVAVEPVSTLPADGQAAVGHVARERRNDQVRGQRPAVDKDQLHQRDGQPVRAGGGRHQRGPPGHRARQPHRLRLPVPRRGIRGSCFPKDLRALAALARANGVLPRVIEAVEQVNVCQKAILFEKICRHYRTDLAGLTIALWGLAFKPGTDDIREAPALVLIESLLQHGAAVRVHDPEAMENVRRRYGQRLTYCPQQYEAAHGADGLAILTEWKHFVQPDFDRLRQLMRQAVIFDGRNLYHPAHVRAAGFTYYSIGRPPAHPGRKAHGPSR